MHHKGRVKMPASHGGGGGGSLAMLPVTAMVGRLHGSNLYRTTSSGFPSKWRRSGTDPLRHAVKLVCGTLLLLCYQMLRGTPAGNQPQHLVQQQVEHEQWHKLLQQHQEDPRQQGLDLYSQQRDMQGPQVAQEQEGEEGMQQQQQQGEQQHEQQQQPEQQQQQDAQQHEQQQQPEQQQQQDAQLIELHLQQEQEVHDVTMHGPLSEEGGEWAEQQQQVISEEQQAIRLALVQHRQRQREAAERYVGPLLHLPPKVALMFLVRGNMPLEPVWREFFATAAQIEPVALPPPFGVAGTQQQQGQQGQQQLRRQRLVAEAASGADATVSLQQNATQAVALVGEEQQQPVDNQQQQAEQQAPQLDELQQQWPPPSEFQKQQIETNKVLVVALGEGEIARQAMIDARNATTMEAPYSMMSPVDPAGVIARQDLFSVYVHTLPGYYYRNTSIFSGYQIDQRVYVSWGQYTVAEAERRLIWEALQNPLNMRFVLLSETCTPLYPPHVFYLQLLNETKSRVNACAREDGGVADRWNSALYMPGVLGPPQWRKSAQWKSLIRQHAQLVVADRRLASWFERECYSYLPPEIARPPYVAAQNRTWVHRTCVSDEHYVPTLLAVHGQDQLTTCSDALTATEWVPGRWSPLIHPAAEVEANLVFRLRKERWSDVDCQAAKAVASAATMFRWRGAATTLAGQPVVPGLSSSIGAGVRLLRLEQLVVAQEQQGQQQGQQQQLQRQQQVQEDQQQQGQEVQQQQVQQQQGYVPLTDRCYLLARKFAPDSAPLLVELARDCRSGTSISVECLPDEQQQR